MEQTRHHWIRDFCMPLEGLDRQQKSAFMAAFLGWTLDAFDFFILVFVLKAVAAEFHKSDVEVSLALTWTLAMRPIGALVFGLIADRFGRRPALMVNVIFYSLMEFFSGFAPNLTVFLVLRALYGVGMGGEWGVGASLAMESVPPRKRGVLSGLLQEGYVVGYILAAIVYFVVFQWLDLGWRWMFFVGIAPAPIVFFIRTKVKESEAWEHAKTSSAGIWPTILANWKSFLYLIALMTAFNFMSHGTQDMYPRFLQGKPWRLNPASVSTVTIISMIGALLGGVFFGAMSERFGRRRTIVIASLLALPVIPLWVFSPSLPLLAMGGFLIQFMVQGAWGVIPAHLNELSPPAVRGTFPGFTYQLGNLFASGNAPLQAGLAERWGGYAPSLATVTATVLVCVAIVTSLGHESRGRSFAPQSDTWVAGGE